MNMHACAQTTTTGVSAFNNQKSFYQYFTKRRLAKYCLHHGNSEYSRFADQVDALFPTHHLMQPYNASERYLPSEIHGCFQLVVVCGPAAVMVVLNPMSVPLCNLINQGLF